MLSKQSNVIRLHRRHRCEWRTDRTGEAKRWRCQQERCPAARAQPLRELTEMPELSQGHPALEQAMIMKRHEGVRMGAGRMCNALHRIVVGGDRGNASR